MLHDLDPPNYPQVVRMIVRSRKTRAMNTNMPPISFSLPRPPVVFSDALSGDYALSQTRR